MFDSVVYAMGANPGGEGGGEIGMLQQFLPLILMFVIFWFLLIRPQQKRAKAHKAMLAELKRGDNVVTSSGIIGRIMEINDNEVLLESGDSKFRVSRGAIGGLLQSRPVAEDKPQK